MPKANWESLQRAAIDMPIRAVGERILSSLSLRRLARLSLAIALFFTPFRYRWTLFEQSLPPVYGDYTNGLLFLGDVFLLLTLALWLLSLALKPRRVRLGPLFLSLPLGGLLLSGALSTLFSVLPLLSLYHLARMAMYTGLYLYVVNEVEDLRPSAGASTGASTGSAQRSAQRSVQSSTQCSGHRPLIWGLAGGVFIQATVGVAQWLAQADLGLQRLGEYELDPSWSGVSIVWAEGVRSLRAYGLSDHPNLLGGLLAFSLLILLVWYAAGIERREAAAARTVVGGVFVLGLAALLLTFSRSAWLGFIAGLVLSAALLLYRRRTTDYRTTDYKATDYRTTDYGTTDYRTTDYRATDYRTTDYGTTDYRATDYKATDYGTTDYRVTDYGTTDYKATDYRATDYRATDYALRSGAALLLAGLIVLTPLIWRNLPYLGVRLGSDNAFLEAPYEKSSLLERAALNQVANQVFADHALTGVGLGTFPAALRIERAEFNFYYQPPHLALLNAAAETGIFGAMFFFLALITPWLAIWLRRRRLNFGLHFVGACAVLAAISVVGLFDYYPWLLAPGRFWQWMAWGLWAAFYEGESRGA